MLPDEDLLVKLYRWAHRQSENFTTEAFAHVLQHLIEAHPPAAVRLLSWLTDSRIAFSVENLNELEVRTQFRTESHGIPDIRLIDPDIDVIVEIKLDGSLTAEQANAYLSELADSKKRQQVLVGLTGNTPPGPLPDCIVLRLWRDLAGEMQQLQGAEDLALAKDPITEREINQLLRLLRHLHLWPPRVESPLADAIELHRESAQRSPEQASLFNSRVCRLETVAEWPELESLSHLLQQMRVAIERQGHHARLESGQAGQWPWIGYTIDDLLYFVELNLDEPRALTLTRHKGGVALESFDGLVGRLERWQGLYRWSTDFELAESGYFDRDAHGQVELLEEFCEASFQYAQRLRAEIDPGA